MKKVMSRLPPDEDNMITRQDLISLFVLCKNNNVDKNYLDNVKEILGLKSKKEFKIKHLVAIKTLIINEGVRNAKTRKQNL